MKPARVWGVTTNTTVPGVRVCGAWEHYVLTEAVALAIAAAEEDTVEPFDRSSAAGALQLGRAATPRGTTRVCWPC